ncbi:hypothetical protein [Staphylococcus carnosus]|uniref:Uncharacterized protein n=2 Tax=Staphylococcus carnosus TaxID=1281 RepID=B9DKN8_STACT|nr:hypothetical protein [Staphylococcus carnosus]ANZ32515.1 hypothetical protein BEK99_01030 [Staphylococcus carnosus]KKB25873.1 hypothetical protein VV61_04745 [Staphylococcus carnosus]KOR13031.1 hypothetical protein AMC75_07160 [Staphylococcus carnosus]POA02796.1 hypothetical protein CD153_05865 [Staphylococcus carnosus]QPT04982.1 hypothetical protein I6G40_06040 [Staphylococcus carnosus]
MKNLLIGVMLIMLIMGSGYLMIKSELHHDASAIAIQKQKAKGITTETQLKAVFKDPKKKEGAKLAAYESAVENHVLPRSKHFQTAEEAYKESLKLKYDK